MPTTKKNVVKPIPCAACEGTGRSSSNKPCVPCVGTGREGYVKIKEAKERPQ